VASGYLDVAVSATLVGVARRAAAASPALSSRLDAEIEQLWHARPPRALAADAPSWAAARARGAALSLLISLHGELPNGVARAASLLLPPAQPPADGSGDAAGAVGGAREFAAVEFEPTLARMLASAKGQVGGAEAPLLARLADSAYWPALSAALGELGPHAPAVRVAVDTLVSTTKAGLAAQLLMAAYNVHPALRGVSPGLSLLRAYLSLSHS
jgi:hypothetical protein